MNVSSVLLAAAFFAACTPSSRADVTDGDLDAAASDAPPTADVPDVSLAPDVADPRFAPVVDALWRSMQASYVPGAAIAVVLDGQLAFATGVGLKRRYRTALVTEHTLFRVGSLTKMITASAVLSLVDEGRIDLAQPITRYADFFALRPSFDATTITTRHLITHTAGLPEELPVVCPVAPTALTDWYRTHTDIPLWSPPGAVWNYSNQNFMVAGLVAETASHTPFADLVRARVLVPAGMDTATFEPTVAMAADHATGHLIGPNGENGLTFEPTASDCGSGRPAGGLYASAVDYAHFIETLLAGGRTMLTTASVDAMMSDQVPTHGTPIEHYGYGLFGRTWRGVRVVEHSGMAPGFQSVLVMVPSRRFGVVVLVNSTYYSPGQIAMEATARLLGLAGPDDDFRTDPSSWGDYVGTYDDPVSLGRIDVELRGTELWARIAGRSDARLWQSAGDSFSIDAAANLFLPGVTFWRDSVGPAQYFVTREGVAHRVP